MLEAEWTPDAHPRWPKGTPKAGHIAAGEFMRIGDLLAKLSNQPSGTQDLTFLARGAERISQVIARRSEDPTHVNFDVHMRDGTSHEVGAGLSTDFGEVMGALQHLDRGGVSPGVEVPQPGAAIARVARRAGAARAETPETPVGADIRPFNAVERRGQPADMNAIATVKHADGSVTRTSHPNVAAAQRHVQRTHGLRRDQIQTSDGGGGGGGGGSSDGPGKRAPQYPKETPSAAHIVQTRSGGVEATVHHAGGSVTKTSHPSVDEARRHLESTYGLGSSRVTVDKERAAPIKTRLGRGGLREVLIGDKVAGRYKRLQNGKWRVQGDPAQYPSEKAAQAAIKKAPGEKPVVARVKPGKPRYSEAIDKLIAQAEADKSINEWPVKPGPGAKGIIPQSIVDHPERDTIGATVLMHTVEGPGGQRVFTPERQALHDRIVAQHLEGHKPQAKKMALFYAGGSASGKSTATKNIGDQFQEPPDAVHIDPDAIKAMLPEYGQLVKAGDRSPSSMTHEESSLLAKRVQAEALKKGLNIVLDGTGDSSGHKFLDKVHQVADQGYEPHIFMVDAPTDVAIARAYKRGLDTGRFIPPSIIRDLHSKVIQSHNVWRGDPKIASWQVWSTYDPANPDARKAIKLAEGGKGQYKVLNTKLYQAMLAKMSEQIQRSTR